MSVSAKCPYCNEWLEIKSSETELFGNFSIKKDKKRSQREEDALGLFKCDSCGECNIRFMICGLCEEAKCAICWEHCGENDCGNIHDAFFGDGIKFCATCSHPYPTPLYQVKKEYQMED